MIMRSRRAASCVLAAAAAACCPRLTAAPPAYADAQISFPVQAMGNLQASPGATLEAGYAFQTSGGHPAARVSFSHANVTLNATCVSGPGGKVITVRLGMDSYVEPGQ